MVLPLVSQELERIWKELSLAYSRYYAGTQGYMGITLCLWMSGFCGSKALQWPHLKVKQSSKCWQPLTQHSVIFQKTWILSKTTIRTSHLSRYLHAGIQKEVHMIQVLPYIGYFAWYRQHRPSGRTTSAPAEPSTMCLPNTTPRHYHDTNLLLYCALYMGRDKNAGNKQNLVLCQEEGEWVNGT